MLLPALLVFGSLAVGTLAAFDYARRDNVAVYWGQDSYGAVKPNDNANLQKPLGYYCEDNVVDIFPVAFLNTFFSTGGSPSINLANTCSPTSNRTFPGTNLADCSALASDIKACQAAGKIVTISLGGAGGSVGFSSTDQAAMFAQTTWDLFLGGSSSTRPFGSAVLDGIDLDIENGGSAYYDTFVKTIRSLANGAKKRYYITATPQCVYPDGNLDAVLNAVSLDAVYGKFYNNPCGLQNFGEANNWNFGLWDNWARTISPNPNVKIYIGAPASPTAAGAGYVDIASLSRFAIQMRNKFPSFGGVMLWDESQAYANNRYDSAIKRALVAAGGTGFTFPACSAPAWVSGNNYKGGSTVSFGRYIWQAKWFASSQPANNANNDWSAISACTGSPSGGTPSCSSVAAWNSAAVYIAGTQVIYRSSLWTAKWWTRGDIPRGSSGAWAQVGACASSAKASLSQ